MRTTKKFYVVAYDIRLDRSRDKLSKLLEKYGVRVNYSVFECLFTEKLLHDIHVKIDKLIDMRIDSVVLYPVCLNCYTKICYHPYRNISPVRVQVV